MSRINGLQRQWRRIAILLLVVIAGLWSGVPPAVRAQGGEVRIAIRPIAGATETSPLPDPLTAPLIPSDLAGADLRDLVENLYIGLFRYDAVAGAVVPVLAKEWTVSADGLAWTFTLRDDISWVGPADASGAIAALRPVAAQDIVAALRRACHPVRGASAGPARFSVQGCYLATQLNPLFVTEDQVAGLVEAEAPDERTLVLRLAFPASYLPALLTDPAFRPIPREFVNFTPAWPSMATSGPYALAGHTPGESLTLVRNPFWPDPLAGNVERITLTFSHNPAAAFAAGEADFVRLEPPAAPPPADVLTGRGDRVLLLGFSTERAFVNSTGVRQALSWALDRTALFAGDPAVVPVVTVTHPLANDGPDETAGAGFAPEAARAVLAAAGYPNCANVPEVIALAVPPGREPLAAAIIGAWESVLGCSPALFQVLTVRPDPLTAIGRDLIDEEYNDRVHLWLAEWTPDYPDAQGGAADAFHCRVGYFYSGIPCSPVDALIDWASTTTLDDDARADAYNRIEARLFGPGGTFPVIPLAAIVEARGVAAGLTGAAEGSSVGSYGPAWWAGWTRR